VKVLETTGAVTAVSTEEEQGGRAFLQQRMAFMGLLLGPASIGAVTFVRSVGLVDLPFPNLQDLGLLSIGVLLTATWLICRDAPRSLRVLHGLDLSLFVALGLLAGVHGWLGSDPANGRSNALLAILQFGLIRATLLPSSPRRTMIVSGLAVLPVVLPALLMPASWLAERSHMPLTLQAALFGIWGALGVVNMALVSRVIYDLRARSQLARQLGRYTLEEKIGEGGMGEVYRAQHVLLRRPTAVKVLRPDRAGEQAIARFELEVQVTSSLTHPNTVAVYDYGHTADRLFYFAMELLDGLDLDAVVSRSGPMAPARVVHVLKQVTSSLREAHDKGVIHRDVKAANIILCRRGGIPDVVKVVAAAKEWWLENAPELTRPERGLSTTGRLILGDSRFE